LKIGKGKNENTSLDDIQEKFENELNILTDIIAKNSARIFSVETLIRKLNTEEYLTNNYQVKNYARVCQLALTDKEVVEKLSIINIKSDAFRQIIEMIANNIKTKTTDKDIINNLCLAFETEEIDDY
jgi:hypothetical protein